MITGWASTYVHPPRRSHDQPQPDSKPSRSPSPDETAEPRRRSSSDATPRQTPAPNPRFLASATASVQDSNRTVLPNSSPSEALTPSSSRRLGFFADKLSSSLSGTGHSATQRSALNSAQLLHPHSHSRVDSALSASRDSATSPLPSSNMASSSSMSNTAKIHTSPSKASYGRTYDSKVVSREMHRLGNLVPSGLPSVLSPAPSVTSLALPAPGSMATVNMASASTGDPWGSLHVHVLPLFNGEPLRKPIEDLNVLVKRHIQTVVSSSPSKALATLEHDASELIASGMVTLNAKLAGIDDDKLVVRVVEIWGFFWDQVLTYVEGVLLPLQTDALLSSLYRTPKPHHRSSSPGRQNAKSSISSSLNSALQISTYHIDVRMVALCSFRDRVILPLSSRLYSRLSVPNRQDNFQETSSHQQPRLQQMLLVLASQSRQRPPAFSLTAPGPQPTAGEAAVIDLLRIVRSPRPQSDGLRAQTPKSLPGQLAHAPSFLSGGLPRDRRGRIAQKQKGKGSSDLGGGIGNSEGGEDDVFGDGAETPRNAFGGLAIDVEREREFLEALRSPDPESTNARVSVGGWGLGAGNEDSGKQAEEEEDEPLDWDQAQSVWLV